MKKGILVSIILLYTSILYGQEKKKFTFGLHILPELEWLKPNSMDYTAEGTGLGFTWGIDIEYHLAENYCLETGLNYQSTGGVLKFPDQEVISSISKVGFLNRDYSIRYIEVPLCLKMKTGAISGMFFWGKFGLSSSFVIGASADDEFTENNGTVTKFSNRDVTTGIATFKEALIIGLGIEYPISGNTRLGVGLIFNNGLSNILSGKNRLDPSISEKANLNQLGLEIAVLF